MAESVIAAQNQEYDQSKELVFRFGAAITDLAILGVQWKFKFSCPGF